MVENLFSVAWTFENPITLLNKVTFLKKKTF